MFKRVFAGKFEGRFKIELNDAAWGHALALLRRRRAVVWPSEARVFDAKAPVGILGRPRSEASKAKHSAV